MRHDDAHQFADDATLAGMFDGDRHFFSRQGAGDQHFLAFMAGGRDAIFVKSIDGEFEKGSAFFGAFFARWTASGLELWPLLMLS